MGGRTGQGEAHAGDARLADAQAQHLAQIVPVEGLQRLTRQGLAQVARQELRLLISHLGGGRQRVGDGGIVWAGEAGGIAQGKHIPQPLHPQVAVAGQAAAAIQGKRRTDRRHTGRDPRGPDHTIGAEVFLAAGGAIPTQQIQAVGLHCHHAGAGAQADVAALQSQPCLFAVEGLGVG